jgi:hypothetical protein
MSQRLGIIAPSDIDVTAWLEQCQLSQQFSAEWKHLQTPAEADASLEGIVWLWNQTTSSQEEQHRWQQYLSALARLPQAIPIIIVATGEVSTEGKEELKKLVSILRQRLMCDRQGWAPVEFVDRSRITLQVSDAAGGQRLLEQFTELQKSSSRWHEKSKQQAERCFTVGVILAAAYFSLLFTTMHWKPSRAMNRSADPLAWVKADWEFHLSDAQQLLKTIGQRSLAELTVPEMQRFNEHLRWLPVSLDLLKQRRATKENLRFRTGVEQLLTTMESLVTNWTKTPQTNLLELTAEQLRVQQLLDGVFEPRQPPSVIHQATQRFWLQERALTLLQLKGLPNRSNGAMLSIVQQRLIACDNARIHAPELKAAWQQELTSVTQTLEKAVAQPQYKWSEATLPALLKEVGVKPE